MADDDGEGDFWNSPRVVQIFANDEPAGPLRAFLAQRAPGSGVRALDLGCGGGRNTQLLAEYGYDVWACDAHHAMVEQTARRLKLAVGGRVLQADMTDLPYINGAFDLVVANGVLHNAYSRDQLADSVAEVARVLAPGGELYLNVFVLNETSPTDQRLYVLNHVQCTYITEDDCLRMTLLRPEGLQELFDAIGLVHTEPPRLYVKKEFTGLRDVYQGWLRKQPSTPRSVTAA